MEAAKKVFLSQDYIGGYQAYPEFDGCRAFLFCGPNIFSSNLLMTRGFHLPGKTGDGYRFQGKPGWIEADAAIAETNFLESASQYYCNQPIIIDSGYEDYELKARHDWRRMKAEWEPEGNLILSPLGYRCDVHLWERWEGGRNGKKRFDLIIRIAAAKSGLIPSSPTVSIDEESVVIDVLDI
jgi:hypothetical protein